MECLTGNPLHLVRHRGPRQTAMTFRIVAWIGRITADRGIIPIPIRNLTLTILASISGGEGRTCRSATEELRISVDDLLAILIPAIPSIPGLEKRQAVYSWGGQDYPQEPITFHWGPYVAFRTSQLQEYLWKFLPEEYRHTNWLVLDVNEEALEML